jgi:hypothetical protein
VLAATLGAAGALRVPAVVPWPLFGAGALYAATLDGGLDGWSLAVGAGLLVAGELAYAAADADPRLEQERALVLQTAAAAFATVAAAVVVGLGVVVAAGVQVGAGLPLALAGAIAAAGLLLLVARLATSSSS